MLELTRCRGQGLHLGNDIFLRVRRIYAGRVELAIDCPRALRIVRGEVAVEPGEERPESRATVSAG